MLKKLLPPTGVAAVFDDDTLRVGTRALPDRGWSACSTGATHRETLTVRATAHGDGHRLLDRRIARPARGRADARRWRRTPRGSWSAAWITRRPDVAVTSFAALFTIVGLALYGLPFYYDFMVRDFGWSRAQVTSGNAISKLLVGPLFGFAAGWVVDRFGPRRLMMAGIVMAGGALVGLAHMTSLWMFYVFYIFNALGYVCGGPLPNQVLLSRWFDKTRGKAMGFAYLGHRHRRLRWC